MLRILNHRTAAVSQPYNRTNNGEGAILRKFSALLLLILVASCARDGSDSVTGTGTTARLSIQLVTTSSHTLRKATLSLDGRDVATAAEAGGAGQMTLEATVSGVRSGNHILRIVVIDQASSPNPYIASGSIQTNNKILDLAPAQGVLKTGEALEMQVSF